MHKRHKLTIANAKNVRAITTYGPKGKDDFIWFKLPHLFEHEQSFNVEILCHFEFIEFPFDDHDCNFELGGYYSVNFINMMPVEVTINEKEKLRINDVPKRIFQSPLPFDIDVKVLKPSTKLAYGYKMSHSGIRFSLRRNTVGVLIGEFYIPTAIFSVLSLLSFSIKHDNVSF